MYEQTEEQTVRDFAEKFWGPDIQWERFADYYRREYAKQQQAAARWFGQEVQPEQAA